VIKGIDLRGAAVHEQEDDPLGPRRVVARPRGEGVLGLVRRLGRESRQGHVPEAGAGTLQHLSPRHPTVHELLRFSLQFRNSTTRNSVQPNMAWHTAVQASVSGSGFWARAWR